MLMLGRLPSRPLFRTLITALAVIAGFAVVAMAHPSFGIVVGQDGTVYFTDVLHHGRGTLWALRPDGRLDTLAKDLHAHSLAIDENGLIYAANGEDDQTLVTFMPMGERDTLICTDDEERFAGGNWAISPWGEIYYGVDNGLWRFTDSTCQKVVPLHLEQNTSLYVDARGRIYAAEVGSYNGDLWRIDPADGSVRVIASDLITTFPGRKRKRFDDVLLGMTSDPYGNLYIAETAGRRVIRIDSMGVVSTFYQTRYPWYATGVAFHLDAAYVLEYSYDSTWGGPRVVRVDQDGDRETLVEIGGISEIPIEEESVYKLPAVAIGVMLLVGLLVWFTFRTPRTDEPPSEDPERTSETSP